jgi:hypothetical protein
MAASGPEAGLTRLRHGSNSGRKRMVGLLNERGTKQTLSVEVRSAPVDPLQSFKVDSMNGRKARENELRTERKDRPLLALG